MARYVSEGVDVHVATCTGGERGSVLNPRMAHDPDVLANLPMVRRREMDAARAILGVRQDWLGFIDSGLPEGDPLPALPEGSFATLDPVVGRGAAGPPDQVLSPARRDDLRRERRLPTPGPHHVPPDLGARVRRGR